jgi:PAS domain S-box-containing protein
VTEPVDGEVNRRTRTSPAEGGQIPAVNERLGDLVREMADAVIVADAEGMIVFWNRAATRLFGWAEDDARGRTLDLIIPERLRARHWAGYAEVMASGVTRYGERLLEVPALHRDGRRLSIAFTVTLLAPTGSSSPDLIAAVIRDETERWHQRRRLEAELDELRRSAGVG